VSVWPHPLRSKIVDILTRGEGEAAGRERCSAECPRSGQENASPGALFKSQDRPFTTASVPSPSACSRFPLEAPTSRCAMNARRSASRGSYVFLLIPRRSRHSPRLRLIYETRPKLRRSRCLRTCRPFLFTRAPLLFLNPIHLPSSGRLPSSVRRLASLLLAHAGSNDAVATLRVRARRDSSASEVTSRNLR